jgi:hypothetical protein
MALPQTGERVHPQDTSENGWWQRVRTHVRQHLQEDEPVVVDVGRAIDTLHEVGIEDALIRLGTIARHGATFSRPSLWTHDDGWFIGATVASLVSRQNASSTLPDEPRRMDAICAQRQLFIAIPIGWSRRRFVVV